MGKIVTKDLKEITMVIRVWEVLYIRVALLRQVVLTISSLFLMLVRLVILPSVSEEVRLKWEMVLNLHLG